MFLRNLGRVNLIEERDIQHSIESSDLLSIGDEWESDLSEKSPISRPSIESDDAVDLRIEVLDLIGDISIRICDLDDRSSSSIGRPSIRMICIGVAT